jgi:hypothetical protein
LHPRGDVRRLAEHLAGGVDHHRPGIKADPRRKLRGAFAGVSGIDFDKRAQDGKSGAHCALGVVLLRLRIAEQSHQPVAELFQHMAAKLGHRRRSLVEIGVDEVAPILGVKFRGQACGPDEVAKHDCDRTALGRCLKALGWSRLRRGSGTCAGYYGDRVE